MILVCKEPLGEVEVGEERELLPDTKNLHIFCSGDKNVIKMETFMTMLIIMILGKPCLQCTLIL